MVDSKQDFHSDQSPQHHVTAIPVYLAIFGSLMVLTALTIFVAFFDLGVFSTPIALLIAVVKATLVILWFMHVKDSTRLTWLVIIGSILFLAILFGLTLADFLSRFWILT